MFDVLFEMTRIYGMRVIMWSTRFADRYSRLNVNAHIFELKIVLKLS